MLFCANRTCEHKWYHTDCLGMEPDEIPQDGSAWYCSDACKKMHLTKERKGSSKQADTVELEYTKAILWHGLADMCRHDAVRENDGVRMLLHWKFDILEFFEKHHPKYFIFAYRFISSVSGGVSERIRLQLLWNRTVNPRGGRGNNIPMDLQMEFYNRIYKESAKASAGQLTASTINRHGMMVGLAEELNAVFDNEVVGHVKQRRSSGKMDNNDFFDLVKIILNEDLCSNLPGRSHKSYVNYCLVTGVTFPSKFKQRIDRCKKRTVTKLRLPVDHD